MRAITLFLTDHLDQHTGALLSNPVFWLTYSGQRNPQVFCKFNIVV